MQSTFASTKATGFGLAPTAPKVDAPFPDLTFITVHLQFTSGIGPGYSVARLTHKDGQWKIFTLFTSLAGVHGHPQMVGPTRPRGTHNDKEAFDAKRARETEHEGGDPDVLISE